MIKVDGYSLEYYKGINKITIWLPQTVFTTTNTIESVVNRKVDVRDEDLALVLFMVKSLFESKEMEGENA